MFRKAKGHPLKNDPARKQAMQTAQSAFPEAAAFPLIFIESLFKKRIPRPSFMHQTFQSGSSSLLLVPCRLKIFPCEKKKKRIQISTTREKGKENRISKGNLINCYLIILDASLPNFPDSSSLLFLPWPSKILHGNKQRKWIQIYC